MKDRAELARERFERENWSLLNPVLESPEKTVQVIERIVEKISDEKDESVAKLLSEALVEIRRLSNSVLEMARKDQPAQPAPVVNVSPYVSAPAVNVSPQVQVTAPQQWRVDVTEHYTFGPMQGKIKTVLFTAM